jgi:hypothetical protein
MSAGLRKTRATARHLVVSDDGPLSAMERVVCWKAHLAFAGAASGRRCRQYTPTWNRIAIQPVLTFESRQLKLAKKWRLARDLDDKSRNSRRLRFMGASI